MRRFPILLAAAAALALSSPALAQLRIATWNVSHYNGTNRKQAFQTSIYSAFQGRQMAPDILVTQEMNTQAGINGFRNLLNTAPGSPGDWAAAPFVASPDGNSHGFFYRTSKVMFIGMTVVSEGGGPEWHPRHVQRYDVRLVGYTSPQTILSCYSTHMKAGSTTSDQQRRLVEAMIIRADAESLPGGRNFLLAGDLNIQSSFQTAYQWLVGAQLNNDGRFFDPIRTPGEWNNNPAFRFVHTQAPAGNPGATGGMDDRLDQILLSASLVDGVGFSYLGDTSVPYSTTTWNDPNHSYRAWGNDGASYKQNITIQGNQMVGETIAQALFDAADTDLMGGHLPVFLDLRVPAHVDSVLSLDFGDVPLGEPAHKSITVRNSGDVSLWGIAGIALLNYSLEASSGFSAPAGAFATTAGAPGGTHIITMDTSVPGPRHGTLIIHSDAPDQPVRVVQLTGNIITATCYADCDTNDILNIDDFLCFINAFAAQDPYADCDHNQIFNIDDFLCFINEFAQGCP